MYSAARLLVVKRQQYVGGQVTVEAALMLPLFIWVVLALLQLIWIFWVQHTLAIAAQYAVRTGMVQHGAVAPMTRTLATAMVSVQPQWLQATDAEAVQQELRQLAVQETAKQWLYAQVAARIQVLNPTATMFQEQAQTTYDLREQRWVQEISIDHTPLRLAESVNPAAWVRARELEIEVWWCLPLEIPLVAEALQAARNLWRHPAQRFCAVRETVVGKPLWALRANAAGPMQSGYRR